MLTKLTWFLTFMTLAFLTLNKRQRRIEDERWMELRLSRSLHGHVRSGRGRLFPRT